MPRRDGDDPSPVTPLRRNESRISAARGYHPRGRTLGEGRPPLRLVSDVDEQPASSRTGEARAAQSARRTSQEDNRRTPRPRTAPRTAGMTATRGTATRGTATRGTATRGTATRGTATRATAGRSASPKRIITRAPEPPVLADQTRRLRLSTALVLALFLVIAGRLVQVQITQAPALAREGLSLRLEEVDLPAPRGSILDRSGHLLAGSAEARYVFADPGLVKDPQRTADALVSVLGVPRADLLALLSPHKRDDGTDVRFEYLVRGVPIATGDAVSALHLDGIGVVRDETRVVPGHDLAANVIGFTGSDLTGLGGLESTYDSLLTGVDGRSVFEVGQPDGTVNLDHEIPGGYHQTTPARPGSSIALTLDRDLQFEIQRILGQRLRAKKADIGAAVVLDVRTGEVLAQASFPFYDAANPFASKASDRVDNASGWAVEPGSVHKGVVFAACLQDNVFTPTSTIRIGTSIRKGDTTFTDTHFHVTDTVTLPGILAYSSNIGTITMADKLGAQKLYDYQRAFGLGSLTGENLPGESAGLVQPPANWSDSSYGSNPDRPRRLGHPAADGGRVRDHRQRRYLRATAPAALRGRRRRDGEPGPDHRHPPGDVGRERGRPAHHAGGGRRGTRRDRAFGRVAQLPGGRQDRHRPTDRERQAGGR